MVKRAAAPAYDVLDEAAVIAELTHEFGDDAASLGKPVAARDYISTQCASLDMAIGRPGIPVGAITNIYGKEASGKSTLTYHVLAETQRRGGFAVLYDSEGAYDYDRGARIGLDFDKLIMLEPANLEQAFDQIVKIIRTVSVPQPETLITIALDSVAGAPAKAQLEGNFGDSHPAAQARAVSQALPVLSPLIRSTKTALLLVNQLRATLPIGPMGGYGGPKDTQIAEGSIRYWSHLRLHFQQSGTVPAGEKESPTGIETFAKVIKNKTAPPFRTARFVIDFMHGIDKTAAQLDVAQKIGAVVTRGGWYKYGERSFRADDFAEILAGDEALRQQIANAPLIWLEGPE
jgi:recombination protein RecA